MTAQTLSRRKQLLFSVLATVGFFLLVELALTVAGVGSSADREDPWVGFAETTPLFVDDGDGWVRTADNRLRLFNLQRFRAEKAQGTVRIFCLGGSTTYGRPYDDQTSYCGWLRELLPEIAPERKWELINAGGISYASYRLTVLMQELEAYDPDIYLVYTGHNEFLEKRTYADLSTTPSWVLNVAARITRTRMGTLLGRAIERLRPTDPDASDPSEDNPGRTVLPAEVVTMLDASVGPEEYHRDDGWRANVVRHFEFNLGHMDELARAADARLVLVAPAANLRDVSPFKSEATSGTDPSELERADRLMAEAREFREAGDLDGALERSTTALALDPRSADRQFELGRLQWRREDWAQARDHFERARDEDVCPLRAPIEVLRTLREVAAARGIPLVDFEATIDGLAEQGIPGNGWFLDHVHPTIEGHRELAAGIVDVLAELEVLSPPEGWRVEALPEVARRIDGRLDRTAHGLALMRLSKVLGWAGKLEEAYQLAQRALASGTESGELLYQAGLSAQLVDRPEEAVRHYRRALELTPNPSVIHGNLAASLLALRQPLLAVEHYRRAIASSSRPVAWSAGLAEALTAAGALHRRSDPHRSLAELDEALTLAPNDTTRVERARTLLVLGRADDAVSEALVAQRADPEDPERWTVLASARLRRGNLEDAIGDFRTALELDPEQSEARRLLAPLLASRGEVAEAEAILRRGLRSGSPQEAAERTSLAAVLYHGGRHEEAVAELRRAVSLDPAHGQALSNLAWILATSAEDKVRNGREAVRWSERALALAGGEVPFLLDVHAAALAEAGRFEEAVRVASRASTQAEAAGQRALARAIAERTESYRNGRPHRQGGDSPSEGSSS